MSEATETGAKGGWGRYAPLVVFLALAAMLGGYLIATTMFGYQNKSLPSALIGRAAPVMTLPPLNEGQPPLDHAALTAPGVKLVNVWASWCGPCRVEHPFLMALKERGVTVHGVNYRDEPANARGFLADLGDPYALIGVDKTGRAGVEWGVYGVPETFVINGAGQIVYKHVGPIQNSDLEKKIMPAIEAAGG